jgi:hypothetical protein
MSFAVSNDAYRQHFDEHGSVELPNFCDPDFALALHDFLAAGMPTDWWFASILPSSGGDRVDIRAFAENNPAIAAESIVASETFLNGDFSHYFYRTFPHLEGCACLVCAAIAWLNSAPMLETIRSLTGRPITYGSAFFASCYTPGAFLSPHTDGDNGIVGLVWQLTRDWRPQYGGALHLLTPDSGRITQVVTPTFNSVLLFDLPAQIGTPHFVSHVAPGVPVRRLAISGWYG